MKKVLLSAMFASLLCAVSMMLGGCSKEEKPNPDVPDGVTDARPIEKASPETGEERFGRVYIHLEQRATANKGLLCFRIHEDSHQTDNYQYCNAAQRKWLFVERAQLFFYRDMMTSRCERNNPNFYVLTLNGARFTLAVCEEYGGIVDQERVRFEAYAYNVPWKIDISYRNPNRRMSVNVTRNELGVDSDGYKASFIDLMIVDYVRSEGGEE